MERDFSRNSAFLIEPRAKARDYWMSRLSGDLVKCIFPYDFKKKGEGRNQFETVEGVFTGEILSSQDGGSSWYSLNQYGFDYASLNGKVLAGGTVSAVPVTVAAWLFSSGLFFLVGMAWRKRV